MRIKPKSAKRSRFFSHQKGNTTMPRPIDHDARRRDIDAVWRCLTEATNQYGIARVTVRGVASNIGMYQTKVASILRLLQAQGHIEMVHKAVYRVHTRLEQ
jgi:predicted transcriptional regulator of viral defense system